MTTQQYVYVASRERKFRINEVLVIEDPSQNFPRGEVVETKSFNRFLPLELGYTALIEPEVRAGLEEVGFSLSEETIHVAKVRLFGDLAAPVEVGAPVRAPEFAEVRDLLVPCSPEEGLVLGVILGTEELAPGLPPELQGIAPLYAKERGLLPQAGVPFIFDHRAMQEYPHIGIFGGSGSGKSFGMRVILEELLDKRVPVLVFDPHYELSFAAPFPGMSPEWAADYASRTDIFTVGQDTGVRFEDLTSSDLAALLAAAGGVLTEAMDNSLKAIHRERDTFASFTRKLEDLIGLAEREEETREQIRQRHGPGSQYEKMLETLARQAGHPSSLRGLRWRLYRLEREGIFRHDVQPLVDSLRRRRLVVVRGPIWLLTVFGAYLVRKLYRMRRDYRDGLQRGEEPQEKFPPFIVATDEAHHFAPRSPEVSAPARAIFREIAQEGRKYGVFLILATQRPALLDETVTAQLNTKIIFRTVRSTDIAVIREETDITKEEADRLPYLSSGTAFISSAVIGRTVPVRIRCTRTRAPHTLNPFAELEEGFRGEEEELWRVFSRHLPLNSGQLSLSLPELERDLGRAISFDEALGWLEEFARSGKVRKQEGPFGPTYYPGGE